MERNFEKLCKDKEEELLNKYFGHIVQDAAVVRSETIGAYTIDLPKKVEAEYRAYLELIWGQCDTTVSGNRPLVLEENALRDLLTRNDRDRLNLAYKAAQTRTLWERITKTNHHDVTYYKGLLQEYTREVLTIMRIDFLEEITGQHINCKAFDE
jgi:hypothetical protein